LRTFFTVFKGDLRWKIYKCGRILESTRGSMFRKKQGEEEEIA
jgi:hypothetical protein